MRAVLKLQGYRRLLVSSLLSEIALSITTIALSLLVYRRTGSAFGATAFFLCAQFGPAFVTPFLTARLDQRSARTVLVSLYGLDAVVFLILAALTRHFSLPAVLILTVIDAVLLLTARVLARSAWTAIASAAGRLRDAQAVTNSTTSVAFMIGPALGGVVVASGGTLTALLANAGIFALMSLNIATTHGLPAAAVERAPSAGRLRAALAYARNDSAIRRLLSLQAVAILFFMVSIPVEVVFATRSLHAGSRGYGVLLTTWGAGAIGGSAVFARWRQLPPGRLMVLGSAGMGFGFLVMAIAPSLAVAALGSAIGGIGNGIQIVAARTALQDATPQHWMAMILSLNESMFQAVPGAGILLGGAVTAAAGPRPALAVGAAGSLAVALAMQLWLPAQQQREPAQAAGAPGLADPEAMLTAARER